MDLKSTKSIKQLITFGAIGLFNTGAFFMIANVLHVSLDFGEISAAYLSYGILVPLSFIGHRRLTFRSNGRMSREWVKFCVIQAVNLLLIWTVTSLSQAFPLISGWPTFATISVLIPFLNFIVFRVWVFSTKSHHFARKS